MKPCSDNAFGPASCARAFDFTLTFEQTILSILTTSVLILTAPLRLLLLVNRAPRTQGLARRFAGIVTVAAASIGLQLALVITWASSSIAKPPTAIPSTALSLIASAALLCLSYFELSKGSRPPILSSVYLLASGIFDALQIRTLWMTQKTRLAAFQTAGTALRIIWLALESQSKTANLKHPFKDYPPEATTNVFGLSLIWWLNDLFKRGFRNLIFTSDLFSLHPKLPSRQVGQVLRVVWHKHVAQRKPLALPIAILDSLKLDLLIAIIPRLLMTGFSFAQPFLITSALTFVEERHSSRNESHGDGLIGATFLIYVGIALSTVYFKQCLSRIITRFRGSMIYLIYYETLDMHDGVLTESAALTHMSTDVDNIIEFLENIYNVWACTLEVGIGTWLLERQLGASCVVPVIVVLLCVAGQSLVAKTIGKDQQSWNQAIQERVSNVSHSLGAIKAIKMSGQSTIVRERLRKERQQELDTSKPFFMGILWLNLLAGLPAIWSPVITFIVFAVQAKLRGQQSLNTVQAFTSLSIITLVTSPASKLLALLPQVAAAGGCFTRIQDYLLTQKRPSSTTSALSSAAAHDIESTNAKLKDLPAVKFHEATICADPSDGGIQRATINRATFTVPKGSITIVVGPTGSGKTTLLRSILKELECRSGSVDVHAQRISLCSQTSFIFYGTIKENICGLSSCIQDFEEIWYKLVVHACDLDQDLKNWSDGDETLVGSKGLKLSGGQRQRLALARALYARNELVLLDDVLSAVDNKTQEIICRRVFASDGILRQLKSTVVMTTHSYRNIQFADQVVVLDRTGAVHVHEPDEHSLTGEGVTSQSTDDLLEKEDMHTGNDAAQLIQNTSTNSPTDDKLMDLTRRTGDLKLYSYYAQTIGWPLVFGFLFTTAAASFTENFPQVWLLWWAAAGGSQLPKYLPVYAVLALAATSSVSASIWIVFLRIMPQSAQWLYDQLVQSVFSAPLSFFISTDSGVTLNRFSQDMSMVTLALPIALLGFALTCFDCIAKMGLIATGSPYVAISIPFTLLTIFVLQHVYLRTSRQLRFLDLENKSPLYGHFTETLEGLVTIRAFGWQHGALDKHIENLDHSQKPYYLLLCIQRWLGLVLDLMVTALAVLVVALAVNIRFATNAGLLGVALNNILSFNQSLASVITSWTSLETSLGAIARVKTFQATTPSESDPDRDQKPPSDWPSRGTIDVRDMSVSYAEDHCVLDHVQMRIEGGQKIGICGRTGSGKSTLLLALLRLVECSNGSITIDGLDIKHMQPDELRQQIITIPQDPFMLPGGTIRSNLNPHGTASDVDVISVLQKMRIWTALESRGGLEAKLPLDQPLSEGEQLLLCLARAILQKKSMVVVLDEATSSVDSETDRVVQEMLMEVFAESTVISVAHRINTILHFDKIAVLDGGRLVEFDTPERLLARGDSIFKQLYDRIEYSLD